MDQHKNFAISAVAVAPNPPSSGTALTVTSGEGVRFPTPPFNVVVRNASQAISPSTVEVLRVTAIANDDLTVQRAQEGTGVRAIAVGDLVYVGVTAKTLTDIEQALSTTDASLTAHASATNNPHQVTKAQVSLGSADNTSDASKPISTAAQTALDALGTRVTHTEDGTAWASGAASRVLTHSGTGPPAWQSLTGQTSALADAHFFPADYGTVDPTGVVSSYDAINGAYVAAVAAGGGIIDLPAGILNINKVGKSFIQISAGHTGLVMFRGKGQGKTIIKTSSTTFAFIGCTGIAQDATVQNVAVEDLTVDTNNVISDNSGVVCHFNGTRINFDRIYIQRVSTINGGNLRTAGNGRRHIYINVTRVENNGSAQSTVTNIFVRDCDLGKSGGGSNVGILITAYCSVTKHISTTFNETVPRANVWFDNIIIERVRWDSGATPTAFCTSAGIQVCADGLGGMVRIHDCYLKNSGDVGIEIGGVIDLEVTGCYAENCWWEAYFVSNNHGGMPVPEKGVSRFRDCVAVRSFSSTTMSGFVASAKNGSQIGEVVLENCIAIADHDAYTIASADPLYSFFGPIRKVILRNCSAYHRFNYVAAANNVTLSPAPLQFNMSGCHSTVDIDGFFSEWKGSFDQSTFTGCALQANAIQVQNATWVDISWRNVRWRSDVAKLNGTSVRLRGIEFTNSGNLTDNFTTDTVSIAGISEYYPDGGALADVTVSGGNLTSVANHATEKRLRWIQNSASGNRDQIQRMRDGGFFVGGTTGNALNGYKIGAYISGSDDGQTYLEGYIDDNGTNSRLRIDKVIAGVRSNLATQNLASRLTAVTTVGAQLILRGDVVTVDYVAGDVPGAAVLTTTYTLSSSESAIIGKDSATGWGGLTWVPQDSTAILNEIQWTRLHVIGGTIERMVPFPAVKALTQAYGINVNSNDNVYRFSQRLRLRNSTFLGLRGAGTVQDINWAAAPQTTLKSTFATDHMVWAVAPTPAVITPTGSGFVYINQDGAGLQEISIFGGTVSNIEISRDAGTTFTQVADQTGKTVRLDANEQVRVTYTVAPTMNKVFVL